MRGPQALAAIAAALVLVLAAGCGGDDEDGNGTAAANGDPQLDTAWLLYGPKEDGGWNVSNTERAQPALAEEFGDAYSEQEVDHVPFGPEATRLTERFVAQGSNVIIDAIGLGELFTEVCEDNLDEIYCFQVAPAEELPANTVGYWVPAQISEYVGGVAAGLMTESNTIGYISAYEVPLIDGGMNAFAMGCRSVNPDCETRVVVINEYFDPPATTQAAETLVDTGADVLRGWVDDPSYCTTARSRGVLAIPMFADASEQCGDAVITSLVWDFSEFFVEQFGRIADGTFESEDVIFVPAEQAFSLGEWGPAVPDDVREEVESTFDQMISGELDPFVGPIEDRSGEVRVPEGERLTDFEMYAEWDWRVPGVVTGGG